MNVDASTRSACALFVDGDELARLAPERRAGILAQAVVIATRLGPLRLQRVFGGRFEREAADARATPAAGQPVAVQLAVEALSTALSQPSIGTLCFLAPDDTLRPLFRKLQGYGRQVVVIGPPEGGCRAALAAVCDSYVPWGGGEGTQMCAGGPDVGTLEPPAPGPSASRVDPSPPVTDLRSRVEARLRLALPARAERERIYAAANTVLSTVADCGAAIPLVDLSYRVAEQLGNGGLQPAVFKILYTLVLGHTFRARRGERPHLIRVQSARYPVAEWDARFVRVCQVHLAGQTPAEPLATPAARAELAALFEHDLPALTEF